MRSRRFVVIVGFVLVVTLSAALPAPAAGTLPATLALDVPSIGADSVGCPLPDRMWPDEPYPYTCPPPVKLSPLSGRG